MSVYICIYICALYLTLRRVWVGGRLIKGDLEDKEGGDGFNVVDKEQIVFKALKPICHGKNNVITLRESP